MALASNRFCLCAASPPNPIEDNSLAVAEMEAVATVASSKPIVKRAEVDEVVHDLLVVLPTACDLDGCALDPEEGPWCILVEEVVLMGRCWKPWT
mmetsp:Transcript_29856/g.44080  ORF Transcript_29856/g.44080 Transcript_29856/m.44080 type:complete len:95 (-) Transcript_29856:120-404(-)